MFWLERDRRQSEGSAANKEGKSASERRRSQAPHVVVSGRQLREEILSYGPAFLEPHRFDEPEAFRALVTVLAAYALGSRTAARLVRERQMADSSWQPPSRREAMQVVSSLNRLRQYLPYLLGQRLQQAAAAATPSSPTPPVAKPPPNTRPRERQFTPRRAIQVTPTTPRVSKPVVNTRPPPPGGSAVVVRPVISLNKRKDSD
jgi:hypothetical protein